MAEVRVEEAPAATNDTGVATGREEDVIDAAKYGDQHRIRVYLDQFEGDVNLRDNETHGTLLHVRLVWLLGGLVLQQPQISLQQ